MIIPETFFGEGCVICGSKPAPCQCIRSGVNCCSWAHLAQARIEIATASSVASWSEIETEIQGVPEVGPS